VPLKHSKAQVDSFSGDAKVLAQHVIQSMPVHPDKHDEAPYTLIFSAELKPLTTHYFKVEQSATESLVPNLRGEEKKLEEVGESIVLENDLVSVEICKTTGSMTSITNKQKKTSIPVTSELFYYQAFQDEHSQRSGAYVFRPDSKRVYPLAGKDNNTNTTVELLDLSTSTEVKSLNYVAFKIGGWATLLYRLNPADNFVEVEWTVGSIPIDDKIGKEVIFRFDTQGAVKSDAKWYTDSNGLEFVERIRNFRPTWNLTLHDEQEFVAANYFPITTGVYIKDESKQFSIVTDRAQGVASLADGQVEVMLHRRLLTDDAKGVDQHLNETETFVNPLTKKEVTTGLIVRGNLYINVDTAADGMQSVRTRSEKQFFEPLVAFRASKSSSNDVGAKDPWLQVKEFPENVGLHTLEELSKECVFTRLLHLYSIDEHTKLSQTVTVDFSDLFTVKNNYISSVTEQNLAGTAPVTTEKPGKKKPEWKTMDSDVDEENPYIRSEVDGMKVELQAMELRAFKVCFAKVKETTKKIQAEEDNHPVGVGELIAIM
jgi:hypothetical protein